MSTGELSLERHEIHDLEARYPGVFTTTFREKCITAGVWALFLGLTLFCLYHLGFFNLTAIMHGLSKLGSVVSFMIPPAHNGWLGVFLYAILETLAMAFLGTLAASLAAVPLGFLGAANVVPNRFVHFWLRRVFDVIRGIDALIWALIFINVVGLGPFAGILAIAVSDSGSLAKLFSEAVENADAKQIDGVKAAGAGPLAVMRLGILPQVLPVFISNSLYYFESNTRSATILGIVGAGGIGLHLSDRIRVNNWDEASFIILLILITVFLIDTLSREIRMRIIKSPVQKGYLR
ncbi:MAG: phosphonate ABC transporter, permease protein PhnE [Desulfovibrionales bacterium]